MIKSVDPIIISEYEDTIDIDIEDRKNQDMKDNQLSLFK